MASNERILSRKYMFGVEQRNSSRPTNTFVAVPLLTLKCNRSLSNNLENVNLF